jgi:hypothetical protein
MHSCVRSGEILTLPNKARQLSLRQMNFAAVGLWPDEAPTLKTLREQTQSIVRGPENFDDVSAFAAKDEDMTREWIFIQCRLRLRG